MLANASGVSGLPNWSMPCRDMYWPVSSVARLTMQIEVVTRACEKRMPSAASRSSRGVRTIRFPATPIESQRVSSMTRTTTFGTGTGGCAITAARSRANAIAQLHSSEPTAPLARRTASPLRLATVRIVTRLPAVARSAKAGAGSASCLPPMFRE